jgi:hypothetical protein
VSIRTVCELRFLTKQILGSYFFLITGKYKQTTERKLLFRRSLRKQEGEFQKDKADVKLSKYWASELGSIRGNMPK